MNMFNRYCWCFVTMCLFSAHSEGQMQTFGAIFSTAEERRALDEMRNQLYAQASGASMEERLSVEQMQQLLTQSHQEAGSEQVAPQPVAWEGVLRLDNGKNTLWINGQEVNESDLPVSHQLVFDNGRATLIVRDERGEHHLRPGQVLDPTGTVREVYELAVPLEVEAEPSVEQLPGEVTVPTSNEAMESMIQQAQQILGRPE